MDPINPRFGGFAKTVGPSTIRLQGADLSGIPEISFADVEACLIRSKAARGVHDDILQRVANGSAHLKRSDLEGLLARAGVEVVDVKTVLAYHARHNTAVFDPGALTFLNTLDWSDVASAHVEELKRQNQEQVTSHQAFIKADKAEFDALTAAETLKVQKANDEKRELQKQSPFALESDFLAETSNSGLKPKEELLLLTHRKRFAQKE